MLGKGDAMWRALRDPDRRRGLLPGRRLRAVRRPLRLRVARAAAVRARIAFVKGFYRRPFRVGEVTLPDGGGRVTELTARPLLNLFYPDLAAVEQPLAGRDRGAARAARAAPVRDRLRRRHRAADRRLPSRRPRRRLPRSTSTCARTPTSRCVISGRWRTPSCRRSRPGWSGKTGSRRRSRRRFSAWPKMGRTRSPASRCSGPR